MKKWERAAAAVVLGTALFMPGMMSEARMPTHIGIPNPLVQYESYERLGQVVGFQPLFLAKSFGYKVDSYIASAGSWRISATAMMTVQGSLCGVL